MKQTGAGNPATRRQHPHDHTAPAHPADHRDLLERATRHITERSGFSLSFGGIITSQKLSVTAWAGTRTQSLHGLLVRQSRGLGGLAMAEQRPRLTRDYGASPLITHDYDGAVLGEGVTSLMAIPIVVDNRVRGILYGGSHTLIAPEGVAAQPAFQIASEIATEIRIREEISRRLAQLAPEAGPEITPTVREGLRQQHAELRALAADISDAEIRGRVARISAELAAMIAPTATPGEPGVSLSPRELDVLSGAAVGHSNAEIGALLGLTEGTVKSYLAAAMTKLDSRSRHAAVSAARRHGLLP